MAVDASPEAHQDEGDDSREMTRDERLGLDMAEQVRRMYPSLLEGVRELLYAVHQQVSAPCQDVEQSRQWYLVDKSG